MVSSCELYGPFEASSFVAQGRLHVTGMTIDGLDGTNALTVQFHNGINGHAPIKWSFRVPGASLAGGRNFIPGPIFIKGLYITITCAGTGMVYIEAAPRSS